jgi:hypothetical protein
LKSVVVRDTTGTMRQPRSSSFGAGGIRAGGFVRRDFLTAPFEIV